MHTESRPDTIEANKQGCRRWLAELFSVQKILSQVKILLIKALPPALLKIIHGNVSIDMCFQLVKINN